MNNENKNQKFPEQGNFSASPNLKNNNPAIQNQNDRNRINQALSKKGLPNHIPNAEQAKQQLVKEGAKAAANAAAGPVGGAAVEAISKTEAGKKVIDNASKNMGKSFNPLKGLNPFAKDEEDGVSENNELKSLMTYGKVIGIIMAVLFALIIVVVIVYLILSPLIYINQLIGKVKTETEEFGEKLGNFLTFRGWCIDEDCTENEKNDFYKEINNVYDDYKQKYGVELNVNLITATLTYSDPFTTEDEISLDELMSSDTTNFRKSKRKIDELAKNMVSQTEGVWNIDITKYKTYLEDDFIRKFYFNNKQGTDIDAQIEQVIDEIFSRVEMFEQLVEINQSDTFVLNNATVTILDCNNGLVIDEVSLYEYLQGVLYLEGYATNRSEEFLKVMAIASKNYLYAINGATPDSMPNNLRIKSCQINQMYCSVTDGCHSMEDGIDDVHSTIASGQNANGEYILKPLVDIEILEKIKSAIDSTFNEFIVKDGSFVTTQYRSECTDLICDSTTNVMDQLVAHEMVTSGNTYEEVLKYFYDGDIQEVSINVVGYPLDLKYNYISSAFGWRLHPINKCCAHHQGTDIPADADANIYSIADGIIETNAYSSTYGNYVVVGHGKYDEEKQQYEYYSLYAHQIRESFVEVGQIVKAGQKIGNVGTTGTSTGNHLHIEIYTMNGNTRVRQDAVEYFKNVELTGFVGGAKYDSSEECIKDTGKGSCR